MYPGSNPGVPAKLNHLRRLYKKYIKIIKFNELNYMLRKIGEEMSKYTQGKQHSKEFASIDMISWSISYADCGKQRQNILRRP